MSNDVIAAELLRRGMDLDTLARYSPDNRRAILRKHDELAKTPRATMAATSTVLYWAADAAAPVRRHLAAAPAPGAVAAAAAAAAAAPAPGAVAAAAAAPAPGAGAPAPAPGAVAGAGAAAAAAPSPAPPGAAAARAAELPVMQQMYAISHILELIHDFIKSRGGPGANLTDLDLDADIDFNVLYGLIRDENTREQIRADYNRQPRTFATLRRLLLTVATIVRGTSVSTIEDAGCICIGELKCQFGYFGGKNPYTSKTSYSCRISLSNLELNKLLQKLMVTHFFTEATGSASKTLLAANTGTRLIPTSVVADPGGRVIGGDPRDGSSYRLALGHPILGDITVTYNKGRTTVTFSTFPDITINRLPSVYQATALASLIPNFMRSVTGWRRLEPLSESLPLTNRSEAAYFSSESETSLAGSATPRRGFSNNSSGATPSRASSHLAELPGTPQNPRLASLEAYVEGRNSNGKDAIESHIDAWVRQRGNLAAITSDININHYIDLIKAYLDEYTPRAQELARSTEDADSDYNPYETERFLETIQEFASGEEESQPTSPMSGKKRERSVLKSYEHITIAERKNLCMLVLSILKKCLRDGRGTFKQRIQQAITTIETLKSLGDRVPMEELMTLINVEDTCAIASPDKLFLANCILYANITGRHIITVEVVKKNGKSSMLIIDHDGSRGANLTPAEREARDRERAVAAQAAAQKAAAENIIHDAIKKVKKAKRRVKVAQAKYQATNIEAKGFTKGRLFNAAENAKSELAKAESEEESAKEALEAIYQRAEAAAAGAGAAAPSPAPASRVLSAAGRAGAAAAPSPAAAAAAAADESAGGAGAARRRAGAAAGRAGAGAAAATAHPCRWAAAAFSAAAAAPPPSNEGDSNRLRKQREAIIADFNSTNPTQNILEVQDDGSCFLCAVILAGGYNPEQFDEFNGIIENPPWGGSPDDIQRLSDYLRRDILVIIPNPGNEGGYIEDTHRRFPDTEPIYIFDYQQAGVNQRHFDAVVAKEDGDVGGFRSHRQRKTLKKRKDRRHTRRQA